MSRTLQIFLLLGSLLVLFVVMKYAIKDKINIRFAVVWIVWAIAMIITSIFPGIIFSLSRLLGFEKPVNAIFLLMIFLLYCLSFYLFLCISKHNDEIISLNYEIAALKKKLEDKEEKNNE
ncbi:MAG: DUF2304 domain-containing protein [Erysipelotrichaceae bacterium]|nr:DUF2304 domain-containing protein [Erysipelotrichaceae bacterium]